MEMGDSLTLKTTNMKFFAVDAISHENCRLLNFVQWGWNALFSLTLNLKPAALF